MMNAKTLLAACLWLLPVTAVLAATAPVVQKKASHTPGPAYPAQAAAKNIIGSGVCQVAFGTSGRVTDASMAESTGSGVLDENTVRFALANWTGRPNTAVTVPIAYKLR